MSQQESCFEVIGNRFVKHLVKAYWRWDECRRWYKWFSVIQLGLAWFLAGCSAFLFRLSIVLVAGGNCCQSTGEGMGQTNWYHVDSAGNRTYSHTEDHGCLCKCLACAIHLAAIGCFLGSVGCYIGSYIFLGLAFTCLYEKINDDAPEETWYWTGKNPQVNTWDIHRAMNRHSQVVGSIPKDQSFNGKLKYTGWVSIDDEQWVYIYQGNVKMFTNKLQLADIGPDASKIDVEMPQQTTTATTVVDDKAVASAPGSNSSTPGSLYYSTVPSEEGKV